MIPSIVNETAIMKMWKIERNERPPSTAGWMCYPLSKPRSTFKIILIIEELINAPLYFPTIIWLSLFSPCDWSICSL